MNRPATSLRVEIESPSLRERTTEVLRNAILSMHFAPGEKLVERRLCADTGVSRTCIREALRHLEAEGLVRRAPNRGMYVAKVTTDEARQIYEVRGVLESAMARRFVERATASQMKNVEQALKRVQKTAFGPDLFAYAVALDGFSNALLDGADNELARQLLNMLRARVTYLRMITAQVANREQKKGTIAALRGIVEALRTRNANLAEERARAYVARSASFAMQLLREREAEQPLAQETVESKN